MTLYARLTSASPTVVPSQEVATSEDTLSLMRLLQEVTSTSPQEDEAEVPFRLEVASKVFEVFSAPERREALALLQTLSSSPRVQVRRSPWNLS